MTVISCESATTRPTPSASSANIFRRHSQSGYVPSSVKNISTHWPQLLLLASLLVVFMPSSKVDWTLPCAPRFSLVGYDEVFFDLNDTGWGQRTGFAQNLLFVGLGAKLSEAKVEAGYLNQFLDGSKKDGMNHILSINLFLDV